jgi:DNA replication protein DnaC
VNVRHPGANPSCTACAGLGLTVARRGAWLTAVPCTCIPGPCPTCGGSGYLATTSEGRRKLVPCACQEVARRAARFDLARFPARYERATLGADAASGPALVARSFVRDWAPGAPGLLFNGDVGTGKTHLAVAIGRALVLDRGASVRFVEFSHLLADLRTSFEVGGAHELLEPLATCDVLVVDEIGKGRNTEFEGTVLDELVSRRYNAAATIVGTTNYAKGPATGRGVANAALPEARPALVDRVGERVASRLNEMCTFVPCLGDDLRKAARPLRAASARTPGARDPR